MTYLKTLFALSLFSGALATGAPITLTFTSATVNGNPGDVVTFGGTLANNSGADLNINSAGINLMGFGPGDSDLTDFVLNFTGLLANGSSLGSGDFFTVTIPNAFANGSYLGVLSVQGGPSPNDDGPLAGGNFIVNVGPVSGVPEPATVWSSVAGLLAIACARRRFRNA